MRFATTSLASLAVLVTAAPPDASHGNIAAFACGNPPLTEEHHYMLAQAFVEEKYMKRDACATIPTINVYFHVLASSETPAGGWIAVSLYRS